MRLFGAVVRKWPAKEAEDLALAILGEIDRLGRGFDIGGDGKPKWHAPDRSMENESDERE